MSLDNDLNPLTMLVTGVDHEKDADRNAHAYEDRHVGAC
jgi:uncharacterized SAM-dependent methyltransferase